MIIYIFIYFKQLLGSPDDSDLGFLRSDNARRYVKQLPHVPKKTFQQKFPNVSPVAMDLAQRMLVFDPSKRITGKSFSLFGNQEITFLVLEDM